MGQVVGCSLPQPARHVQPRLHSRAPWLARPQPSPIAPCNTPEVLRPGQAMRKGGQQRCECTQRDYSTGSPLASAQRAQQHSQPGQRAGVVKLQQAAFFLKEA